MNSFNKRVVLDAIDDSIAKVSSYCDSVNVITQERDYSTYVTSTYLKAFKRQLNQLNDLKIYVSNVASDTTVNLTQDQFNLIQNYYQK